MIGRPYSGRLYSLTLTQWPKGKFVADVVAYDKSSRFDGRSPLIWRQGVKHDCSRVMELARVNSGLYRNSYGEVLELEENVVYSLLKNSDLNRFSATSARLWIPIAQQNQMTTSMREHAPKLWTYFESHREDFNRRKSPALHEMARDRVV